MSISFEGFNNRYLTFTAGAAATVGKVVELTAAGTVQDAASGSFTGRLVSLENGLALVQVTGMMTLPFTETESAPLPLGHTRVGAAADGGIQASATGRNAIVVGKGASTADLILL